jgi:hypothetical protein
MMVSSFGCLVIMLANFTMEISDEFDYSGDNASQALQGPILRNSASAEKFSPITLCINFHPKTTDINLHMGALWTMIFDFKGF